MGTWALELVVCGFVTQWQTCGCDHEFVQSARLNEHDPYAYLKDVLTRLPTQRACEIAELLPHNHPTLSSFGEADLIAASLNALQGIGDRQRVAILRSMTGAGGH